MAFELGRDELLFAVLVAAEEGRLKLGKDRIIELACLPFHFSSEGVLYDVLALSRSRGLLRRILR